MDLPLKDPMTFKLKCATVEQQLFSTKQQLFSTKQQLFSTINDKIIYKFFVNSLDYLY